MKDIYEVCEELKRNLEKYLLSNGLEKTAIYIFTQLIQSIPLCGVSSSYKGYNENKVHSLFSFPPNIEHINDKQVILIPEEDRKLLYNVKLDSVFCINDIDSEETAYALGTRRFGIYDNTKSILMLPFYVNSKYFFFLSFSSREKNVFTNKIIKEVSEIIKMMAVIVNEYSLLLPSTNTAYILQSIELLEMCPCLKNIKIQVSKVANKNTTVLLLGETGTGKEVVAKSIHENSKFKDGPFVKVNCGAIPETLLDSEFFGYDRGAFTGAYTNKAGYFELANNGTLFLDEIGELSLLAQIRLLRVLEEKSVRRVGGSKSLGLNFRVIAATRRDLKQMVTEGKFREDLWYRLNIFPISIPPLKERKQDISILANYFIQMKCAEEGIEAIKLPQEELLKLFSKSWEGNVRELEHEIERALIHNGYSNKEPLFFEEQNKSQEDVTIEILDSLFTEGYYPSLDQFMSAYIRCVLNNKNWKIKGPDGAASALGLHPSTLRSKMEQLGITKNKIN